MSVPVFRGVVKAGQLRMNELGRWHGYLASMEGKFVRVVVERETTRRSSNQNRWYRGVIVPAVRDFENEARGKRYTNDDIHFMLKRAFLGADDVGIPGSTSDLSIEKFSSYCNEIVLHYAERGLPIPAPGEAREETCPA